MHEFVDMQVMSTLCKSVVDIIDRVCEYRAAWGEMTLQLQRSGI